MAYSNIDKPSKYFNTVLYTGNGSSQSITGVGFQPDFTWIKERNGASTYHALFDAVRGVTKAVYTNDSIAEITGTAFTSFNSDGFTVGLDITQARANDNSDTYVAWNWDANGAGVSNTSGSITSTVSANTTSGFSIVSYTGNASNSTVGHSLGTTPSMIIVKNRSAVEDWTIYHSTLGNTKFLDFTTGASQTSSTIWNNTSPTSTLFTVGTNSKVNGNTNSMIAYCFAEVKGFSKFGSYTGNNSSDGTFVYLGFKPAFVMIKTTSAAEAWNMGDNKRNITYPSGANVNNAELYANSSSAETDRSTRGGGITQFDMLSNGFKCRGANPDINYTGYNYIYMAFAESPFVSSKGIPTTAR